MRKFVLVMILSLIINFLSIADIFLLQAPLLTFVYYGLFSVSNSAIFSTRIINNVINIESTSVIMIVVQFILTFLLVIVCFIFITKITNDFFKEWGCRTCGYVFLGNKPPKMCPLCKAKRESFYLKKYDKLIRPYYILFFFITLIVPVIVILISILFRVKLTILTIIFELIIFILNTVLIIFSKKLFPETTDSEYRRYLFTNGESHV